MSKAALNGPGESFITISTFSANGGVVGGNAAQGVIALGLNGQFNSSGTVGTIDAPGVVQTITGTIAIQVEGGHNLCVTESNIFVTGIKASGGTIKLHNNYPAAPGEATNIVVGDNSQVILSGTNLCMGSVTLGKNSELNFTHDNTPYQFHTSGEFNSPATTTIHNMDKLVSTCEFINSKFTTTNPNFTLDEICYLRDYQKVDSKVRAFIAQNNMTDTNFIDRFIAENYFEFTTVAHELIDSDLEVYGPYNILGEICSWLELSDVNLSGVDHSGLDHS